MINFFFYYYMFFSTCFLGLYSQTVKVSDYGFETRPSKAIHAAMLSPNDTIIIDKQNKAWVVEPIEIKNVKNKTVIIEQGVEIIAKKHAFANKSDVLLEFIACENIRIIGNGAKLCMNKNEYTDGEWRHGISLRSCKNISIENINIRDTGGDGIYIAGTGPIQGSYSENIQLDRIISTNNKRQGISIISGKNIAVTNSIFENTIGTLPGAGIDLEPNTKYDRLENIIFKNCISRNNDHSGILLALGKLEKNSEPVSITFQDCVLQNNHNVDNRYIASEIVFGARKTNPVGGTVVLDGCVVENSKWGLFYSRKTDDAYHVTFKNCHARNICQDNSYPAIYLEVPDYRSGSFSMGGFTFENLYLSYSSDVPVFTVRGSTLRTLAQVSEIHGTIILDTPKTDTVDYIKYNPSSNSNFNLDIQVRP